MTLNIDSNMRVLQIVMGQLNFLVGDVKGNTNKVLAATKKALMENQADIIVFPELTLTGYPPEDIILRNDFWLLTQQSLQYIQEQTKDDAIYIVIGHHRRLSSSEDQASFNSATVLYKGKSIVSYNKQQLPNYQVFDEKRYFTSGHTTVVFYVKDIPIGLAICEDIWDEKPITLAVEAGAGLIVVLNASPFHINKQQVRYDVVKERIGENAVPLVYVNLVGGQDELVFDGGSFVMDNRGRVCWQAPFFKESLECISLQWDGTHCTALLPTKGPVLPTIEESLYQALVLGVGDYVRKNAFPGVIIGLSGGIDSALTLAIAVDALGADKVEVMMMPSRYNANISLQDAIQQAKILGVNYHVVSIEPLFTALLESLSPVLEKVMVTGKDTTEENLQARCRGILLMALSNKSGKMVLTTGNKSEVAVGYATLYGDMVGGFSALKDVFKTQVYQLAHYRNSVGEKAVIPERVIKRPPSAELAADQQDSDSLPDYVILDAILRQYIEEDKGIEEIIATGFDMSTVKKVVKMVKNNEYKRRQAAPGVRVSTKAFGRDRRYPITYAHYDE